MGLGQLPHERKAEAKAPVPAGHLSILLSKSIEDVGQEIAGDPLARVRHHDLRHRLDSSKLDFDGAGLRRELDRVRQKIPDDLPQPIRVTCDDELFIGIDVRVNGHPGHQAAATVRWQDRSWRGCMT